MKPALFYGIIAGVILLLAGGFWLVRPDSGPEPSTEAVTVRGVVQSLSASARVIVLDTAQGEISVALDREGSLLDSRGNSTQFNQIQRGFELEAIGQLDRDSLIASEIRITREPNIIVFTPIPNGTAGLPLVITGTARVFENQFNYRVKNSDGTILKEGSAYANSPDTGLYGPFEIRTNYPEPKSGEGIVEVFDYSARDGEVENLVSIPVKFQEVPSTILKVYFANQQRDPEMMDCQKVYPVNRRVPRTEAPARMALEELLAGPTGGEYQSGYLTSINSGVKIQSLTIVSGTARVDFDDMLEAGVGGSCRVANIRSQIVNTLKQFPTVQDVIISIDGRTEDILQP